MSDDKAPEDKVLVCKAPAEEVSQFNIVAPDEDIDEEEGACLDTTEGKLKAKIGALKAELAALRNRFDEKEQDRKGQMERVRELKQANTIRRYLAKVLVKLFFYWFWFLFAALILCSVDFQSAWAHLHIHISDTVAMVVFGTTTATILGSFWIMASHFFYRGSYSPKKLPGIEPADKSDI